MNLATLRSKGLIRPVTAAPARPAAFPYGLGVHGVHEVAETAYGHWAAVTGFTLAMTQPSRKGACLWVCQASASRDAGHIPAGSLRQMTGGRAPRLCVIARKSAEALWSAEEGIMSGAVSHVVVELEEADFTATRRLALASEKHGVPVTLLLPHTCSGATASGTRWRVGTQVSAMNRHDPRAPLERPGRERRVGQHRRGWRVREETHRRSNQRLRDTWSYRSQGCLLNHSQTAE